MQVSCTSLMHDSTISCACRQPTGTCKEPGSLVSKHYAQCILGRAHSFGRSSRGPGRAGALSSQPGHGAQTGVRSCAELGILATNPSPGEVLSQRNL